MAKPVVRIAAIQFVLGAGIALIVARSAQLQIVDGAKWKAAAETQRSARDTLPARRGALYDRTGSPLAITQEFYHIGVAPNELDDRQATLAAVAKAVDVPLVSLARDARTKKYLYFHGPFTATQVQPLRGRHGVHLDGEYRRAYPARDLARVIIGSLSPNGESGASGIELALDSVLTGEPGEAVFLKDRRGRKFESPSRLVRDPVPGLDVWLSIDAELQEIAERGLDEALGAMSAEGGDVVFLDPSTGELLALASRSGGEEMASRASTFTDPFEPGSTAKLFTAAALLAHGRVDSTSAVYAENGEWDMAYGKRGKLRRITDSHKSVGSLTLAQAIQVSSNIAMAKFSAKLTPEEQYDMLRDFGFGSPSGTEFPSESRGRLARPDRWTELSRPSLAMGYEFGVTPVQLAAAYGAIANDGVLLAPTLVREIHAPDGSLLYRHHPEPVRRVIASEVAAKLRQFLAGAVGEGGTGEQAQLVNYSLLGKTGTAVRFENGRYVKGTYTASFAALFPADDPQLVVIVKIDDPKGNYYGGLTAAPLTRRMLDQALASRRVAIDRARLAARDSAVMTTPTLRDARSDAPQGLIAVAWPKPTYDTVALAPRQVPDVAGASVRQAALALHRRGFRVSLRGMGKVARTTPAAGESAPPGTLIAVWTNP